MGQENQEYTWNLIARKLTGESSPEELQELEEILRNNPDLHYSLQTISDLWRHFGPEEQKRAEQAFDLHITRMENLNIDFGPENNPDPSIEGSRRRRRLIRSFTAAAIVIALFGVIITSLTFYRNKPSPSAATNTLITRAGFNEVATNYGSRTNLSLPDGTRVWLNAGSHLTYGKSFGLDGREVTLIGEAFFDVTRNSSMPFLIHTARVDIKVLGTTFNIKSYPTDPTTEATLVHGSIEVAIKARPNEKIILRPNEKLIVANDDSALFRNPDPLKRDSIQEHGKGEPLVTIRQPTYEHATGAIVETTWVEDRLSFQDKEFGALASEMERWYGMSFRFTDPEQEKWRFTGSFQKETIQQALDALKLTAAFTYTIHNNQITILNK